jgi:ADP-ribosylglycohydrolase
MEQPPEFEEVVGAVVNAGGDTDTNGAVAGAVMGARLGIGKIPGRWRGSAPRGEDLIELANRLRTLAAADAR